VKGYVEGMTVYEDCSSRGALPRQLALSRSLSDTKPQRKVATRGIETQRIQIPKKQNRKGGRDGKGRKVVTVKEDSMCMKNDIIAQLDWIGCKGKKGSYL
jgi:hypothetical protein